MNEFNSIVQEHPMSDINTLSWVRSSPKCSREAEFNLLNTSLEVHYPAFAETRNSVDTEKRKVSIGWVKAGSELYINTLCNHAKSEKVLLINHGYGGGLGIYFKNYVELLALKDWRIYSIDWMGMGNSSRPAWIQKDSNLSEIDHAKQAEDFFIDALEKWRESNGIHKMTIMGHSLGGYLSACYALKYPDRVEKLILASPVGVPKAPEDQAARVRNRKGFVVSMFIRGWRSGMTPFDIIRFFGPFGSSFFSRYTTNRFRHLEEEELKLFHDYLYHISSQPGSGEYSLSAILHEGAWAKYSLEERIHDLNMPVTFLYGTEDWMDHNGALGVVNKIKHSTRIILLEKSGHHLYIDNPQLFNQAIIAELTGQRASHDGVKIIYEH
jgi:pimeloyl-ACP methyl ester carboxylesterase